MSVRGLRLVIIGGSSGIGLATAKMAYAEGADVVIASRSREKLENARSQIGETVDIYELDVRDEASLQSFFNSIGKFDHLATPGSEVMGGAFLSLPTEDARTAFDSKFWGQYNAAKYGAPGIRKGGSIVLFSGVYATRPPAGTAPIASVNGAVEALGRELAVELSPIRVNVVSPGLVDTPVYDSIPTDQRVQMFEKIAEELPARRYGRPEDIALTVLYLMSNPFQTGSTVHVDGGASLR